MKLKIGQAAPDFKVADQDGEMVSMSQFRGKKVVLFFYPKDQTPGCTAEACNLRDHYSIFQKKGFELLGVSTDTEKAHQKFRAKEKLPFRLLADTEKKVHTLYKTWGKKTLFGRTYMGTLRTTFVINEQGNIMQIIDQVDTKNHTEQIIEITN